MRRLLDEAGDLEPAEKAEIMGRSLRPAHRLAALNFEHLTVAYHSLLGAAQGPAGARWFEPKWFEVQERDGRPSAVDFAPEVLVAGKPHTAQLDAIRPVYATHGCPARISPTGGSPPITRLWTWCVELALQCGLLG
jgi:hypothetical protein